MRSVSKSNIDASGKPTSSKRAKVTSKNARKDSGKKQKKETHIVGATHSAKRGSSSTKQTMVVEKGMITHQSTNQNDGTNRAVVVRNTVAPQAETTQTGLMQCEYFFSSY